MFEASERSRTAHYKVTSTVMLYMAQGVAPASEGAKAGEVALGGSMTRQVSTVRSGAANSPGRARSGRSAHNDTDLVEGFCLPQNEADAPHDPSSPAAQAASHISNLGRLVEGTSRRPAGPPCEAAPHPVTADACRSRSLWQTWRSRCATSSKRSTSLVSRPAPSLSGSPCNAPLGPARLLTTSLARPPALPPLPWPTLPRPVSLPHAETKEIVSSLRSSAGYAQANQRNALQSELAGLLGRRKVAA